MFLKLSADSRENRTRARNSLAVSNQDSIRLWKPLAQKAVRKHTAGESAKIGLKSAETTQAYVVFGAWSWVEIGYGYSWEPRLVTDDRSNCWADVNTYMCSEVFGPDTGTVSCGTWLPFVLLQCDSRALRITHFCCTYSCRLILGFRNRVLKLLNHVK
jgi:hypothetical protein